MPRANPTNHVAEMRSYYGYYAPEHGMDRKKSDGRVTRRAKSFKEDFLDILGGIRNTGISPKISGSSPISNQNGRPAIKVMNSQGRNSQTGDEKTPEKEIETCRKEIDRSLDFIRKIVEMNKIEMLHSSATIVLENVLAFHALVHSHVREEQSTALAQSTTKVFQSLAALVKWSDTILINGDEAFVATEAGDVIRSLKEAIQNHLSLVVEKMASKPEPPPLSPLPQLPPIPKSGFLPDIPLTPREKEILETTRNSLHESHALLETPMRTHSKSSDSILDAVKSEDRPPPKPPMLKRDSAPPLPPKRRRPLDITGSNSPSTHVASWLDTQRSITPSSLRNSRGSSSPHGSGSSLSIDSFLYPSFDDSLSNRSDELDAKKDFTDGRNLRPDRTIHRRIGSDGYDAIFNDKTLMNVRKSGAIFTNEQKRDIMDVENRLAAFKAESGVFTSLPSEFSSMTSVKSSVKFESRSTSSTMIQVSGQNGSVKVENKNANQTSSSFERRVVQNSNQTEVTSSESHGQLTTNSLSIEGDTEDICLLKAKAAAFSQMKSAFESLEVEPPPLPLKSRSKRGSVYDNVSNSPSNTSHSSDDVDHILLRRDRPELPGSGEGELDPPPLPPKKKAIDSYMNIMVGDYSVSSASDFIRQSVQYSTNKQSMYTSIYSQRSAATLSTALVSTENSSSSVTSEILERLSQRCINDGDLTNLLPPALPPKKRLSCSGCKTPDLTESENDRPEESCQLRTDDQALTYPSNFRKSDSPPSSHDSFGQSTNSTLNESLVSNDSTGEPTILDEQDVTKYLVYGRNTEDSSDVKGGPVDALVVHATLNTKKEFAYQEAFLTTYRTFLGPEELITKLLYRYNRFTHKTDVRRKAANSAFSLLVRVVDDLAAIDLSAKVVQLLTDFAHGLISSGCLVHAKALRTKLLEKHMQKRSLADPFAAFTFTSVKGMRLTLLEFKPEALAEQMTLMDANYFSRLEPAEVLLWAKEQNDERSPNLTKFTEHFNKVSFWARSQILEKEDAKEREKFVIKYLKIMKHLRRLNNFNSYLALLSALDSAPVRRLEWQKQITDGLTEYCALIDSSSSFRAYRQALSESEPPCIPYLGLILQDLTFVNIGNPDYLPDGNVNFAKRWQQFHILENMKRFKKCNFPFKRDERIILFFNEFNYSLSEDAMWSISETIKPRGGTNTMKKNKS